MSGGPESKKKNKKNFKNFIKTVKKMCRECRERDRELGVKLIGILVYILHRSWLVRWLVEIHQNLNVLFYLFYYTSTCLFSYEINLILLFKYKFKVLCFI